MTSLSYTAWKMKFRARGSWDDVQRFLEQKQLGSVTASLRRERYVSLLWALFLLAIVGLYLPFFLPANSAGYFRLVYFVLVLPGVPLFGVLAYQEGKGILDEDKLAAAVFFLQILKLDARRKGKVWIELDLQPLQQTRKSVAPGDTGDGKWGPCEHYRQRWLRLKGALAEGHQLDLTLTRRYRERLYPKRSQTRVKARCQDVVWARVPFELTRSEAPLDFRWFQHDRLLQSGNAQQSLARLAPTVVAVLIWVYAQRPRV